MLARRRDAPDCIISTAQQASPNVIGIIEPLRAQLQSSSSFVTTNSAAATKREILRRHNARGEETYKITPGPAGPSNSPAPLFPLTISCSRLSAAGSIGRRQHITMKCVGTGTDRRKCARSAHTLRGRGLMDPHAWCKGADAGCCKGGRTACSRGAECVSRRRATGRGVVARARLAYLRLAARAVPRSIAVVLA
jgi:hypothetical protein